MFEAGFTCIFSKSLMNTRTKKTVDTFWYRRFFSFGNSGFVPATSFSVLNQCEGPGDGADRRLWRMKGGGGEEK